MKVLRYVAPLKAIVASAGLRYRSRICAELPVEDCLRWLQAGIPSTVLEGPATNLAQSRPFARSRQWIALAVGVASTVAIYVGHGHSFVSVSYDPHAINCLPEVHLALLVHHRPTKVRRGDYLFWKSASTGALSYVTENFVMKKVAGVPGDHLSIREDRIFINGRLVVEGLEDAILYRRSPAAFQRAEVIPPGNYFVIGTARLSNDSRYWGYLAHDTIVGVGYRIY